MKRKRWLKEAGGVPNLFVINNIGFSIIILLNSIEIIFSKMSNADLLAYVFPFIIVLCLNIYFQKKKIEFWIPVLFYILSISMMLSSLDEPPIGGAIFLIFSIHLINKQKLNIMAIILYFIFIIIKCTIMEFDINKLLSMSFFHVLIISMYFAIYRKTSIEAIIPSMSYEDLQIVQYLAIGKTKKEIASDLYITADAVSKRLGRIRKQFNVETNEQLIYNIAIKGLIRQK